MIERPRTDPMPPTDASTDPRRGPAAPDLREIARQDGPRRILFLSHYFPPEGNAPANRVYESCKRWVNAGHEVTVITCVPNHPSGVVYEGHKSRFRRQVEMVEGIKVIRVWTVLAANKGRVRRSLNYASYLMSAVFVGLFTKRPDVLIATSPQFFCGLAGTIVRTLRRVPFILEIRDIWPESISTVGALKSRVLLKPLEWMERWMYHSATHIVTLGDGYREQLLAKGVDLAKLSVVTNGIDPSVYAPQESSADLRQKFGLEGKFVCASVGTIGMASGLDVVLRAAARLKEIGRDDIVFLLVGEGAVREELQARAVAAGLDNVVFTGRQDKQWMPAFLATADACLVHLVRKELFRFVLPSKMFEAAAMERPIILGVEGHAKKLLRDADAGLFIAPESEVDLVEAVTRLADDPEFARRLGQSGRRLVLRDFDRDVLSANYLEVLRQTWRSSTA